MYDVQVVVRIGVLMVAESAPAEVGRVWRQMFAQNSKGGAVLRVEGVQRRRPRAVQSNSSVEAVEEKTVNVIVEVRTATRREPYQTDGVRAI